jgi:hypothetical protein
MEALDVEDIYENYYTIAADSGSIMSWYSGLKYIPIGYKIEFSGANKRCSVSLINVDSNAI